MITKAEIRQAAIDVGIPADDVDRLLGDGLVLLVRPNQTVSLRVVMDLPDQPKRLGTMGCSDSYCDGPAGHDGQHYQWVPE